ncbi:unnamed protein product [Knipowitschia caucasica]
MATNKASVLKDVVAYVDVWSSDKTENFSEPFILKLEEMGAQVKKRFSKHVTHVIFSYGHPATWRNAKKDNVKLVSVLWVNRCYEEAERVNEDLFPALSETNPALLNKKHRCMQPKDSPERTPNSDKRMKKKLDKMMKNVTPSMPLFKEFSPIIIDEESGIIYSPAFKRSDYMARRLKERKEENDHISESQIKSPSDRKPSLGNSPTVFKCPYNQSDDEAGPSVAETGSAAESPAKEEGTSLPDIKQHHHEQETTEQLRVSSWSHGSPEKISVELTNVEGKKDEENLLSSRGSSRRITLKHMESIKANLFTNTPDTTGTSDSKKNKKVGRRSSMKSTSSSKGKKPLSSECTSKKGKGMTKTNNSSEETKTLSPENVNYATNLFTTAISTLSLETTSPEGNTNSKQTSLCSALVQPDKLSCETLKNVLCTADGDDDVFEDYFSPANLNFNKKKARSIGPIAKTEQFPFELDSGSTKVKPRRSDSAVNDINMSKKKQSKLHFKDLHTRNASEELTDLAVSAENLKPLTKKRRYSALPCTSMSAPSTTQRKQPPQCVKQTKSEDTDAALESHEKPDCSLRSDSVTSE